MVYFLIVADLAWRDVSGVIRAMNAGLAAAFVGIYLLRRRRISDWIERGLVVALVLFAVGGAFSMFPRQAFDAVLAGLLYLSAFVIARTTLARPTPRGM